jgi:hypothetical protein
MTAQHLHHVTGRSAPEGQYLDRVLTLPLAPRAHVGLHVALRAVGLDFPKAGVDLLIYRQQRTAVQFRLLAAAGDSATFGPAALWVVADLLNPPEVA